MSFTKEDATMILEQLAGSVGALKMMTGAKNIAFSSDDHYVRFHLGSGAKRIGRNAIKFVKITLNNTDLYDIEFGGERKILNDYGFKQSEYVALKKTDGIYASMLKDVFEETTGFLLAL